MSIRGHETLVVGIDAGFIASRTGAWCGHTTETPILHLMEEFPMRVFVTGATGYIGSAIVRELLAAEHQVLGLARSDTAAAALTAAGAEVHRGNLDDLDSLRSGAVASDGVIHMAFTNISDTTDFAASVQVSLRAVEAIGAALEGSGKPFVVTSGTLMVRPGRLATEQDPAWDGSPRGLQDFVGECKEYWNGTIPGKRHQREPA
jgi:nucleoside-diphosphate-sugar epimerase